MACCGIESYGVSDLQLRKEVVIPLQTSEEKGEISRQNVCVKCAIAKKNYEKKTIEPVFETDSEGEEKGCWSFWDC